MLKIKVQVIIILFAAWGLSAFSQGVSAYKIRVGKLIEKGIKSSRNSDSLLSLINELKQFNSKAHDKTALVYIDYYQSVYEWQHGDFYKSMQLAVQSLDNAQKWKISGPLPSIYGHIGRLHKENTNYPMAFAAAEKGLDAARQNKDTGSYIELLGMQAMFKRGYSLHFDNPVENDGSLALRLEGLRLAESSPKYERLRISLYDDIAQHYKEVKDYTRAKDYANKGIALALKYDQKRSLTFSYNTLGQAYFRSGQREAGLTYIKKALQIATEIKLPYRRMELYDDLAHCYSSSSDYKDAFLYLTKYRWLVDSLQVRVNEKQIGELQIKYETAKKDKALALLKQAAELKSKQLTWVLAGALVFLLLIVVLIYMYGLIHRKNDILTANNIKINEQSTKLQLVMKELHHRVKNNLQIVSSLLNLQSNRVTDAEARSALNVSRQRIEAMSVIHNSLYQHDNANKVDMKVFLPILINNILESFGIARDEIDISMEIQIEDIDVDIAMPLGLIINEWITNIYKHAYQNIRKRPYMEIRVYKEGDQLKLKINDNGIGMPLSVWDNPKGSFGVKLIKILIKQIGAISHVSNTDGTTMELDIPYVK